MMITMDMLMVGVEVGEGRGLSASLSHVAWTREQRHTAAS
jgi:hypothetical protein